MVADEVELLRTRLARVPDLVEVRVDPHGPAQHHGVEVQLIDPLFDEHRPFHEVGAYVDADLLPGVLGDGQDGFADIVAAVGEQGELQLLSVFFEAAVGVALPAGFGQQLQGAFGSYGTGAMAWL